MADPSGNRRPTAVSAELLRQARDVLDLLAPPSAAYVIDRVGDVLAWNTAPVALFVDHFPADVDPADVDPADVDPADVDPADADTAGWSSTSPPEGAPTPWPSVGCTDAWYPMSGIDRLSS
jgi:hypothetical protein